MAANTRNEFGINTLRRDQSGVIHGRADPEKEFQMLEKLGEGSYGSVWKALHRTSGKTVAVKRVPVDEDLTELVEEINVMKECRSPFVVEYMGSYFKDPELWIVMEFCVGGSVMDIMQILGKTLSENQISVVVWYMLQGLKYLHSIRKIHRDIKSGNILLNNLGEAKLADFGVSGQLSDNMAKKHTVIGTPYWMAPEVIKEVGYDVKADIWSLGITCIEMAEGNPPHHSLHPMRAIFLIPSRPPPTLQEPHKWGNDFVDFIAKCLTKDPVERPSAEQLLQHPFAIRGGKKSSLLADLVDETLKMIASLGSREEALGLNDPNDDDDSDEDGKNDDDDDGGGGVGTMVVTSTMKRAAGGGGSGSGTSVVTNATPAAGNAAAAAGGSFVPQYEEMLRRDDAVDYSKYNAKELMEMLKELDKRLDEDIDRVRRSYEEMKNRIQSRLDTIA